MSLNLEETEDDNPTDESGSDSDGAESTSSSYSSLSDFVIDIQNSDINGETPGTGHVNVRFVCLKGVGVARDGVCQFRFS